MRVWWNWQTRMIQVHVSQDLQVQVLLPAPNGYYIKNNFNIWRRIEVVITGLTRKIPAVVTAVTQQTLCSSAFTPRSFAFSENCISHFSRTTVIRHFCLFYNWIWRCIEVVVTRTIRNRFVLNRARGFESHHLRQNSLEDKTFKEFLLYNKTSVYPSE